MLEHVLGTQLLEPAIVVHFYVPFSPEKLKHYY